MNGAQLVIWFGNLAEGFRTLPYSELNIKLNERKNAFRRVQIFKYQTAGIQHKH